MNSVSQPLRHIPLRYYLVFIPGFMVTALLLIYTGSQGIDGTFIYPFRLLFQLLNWAICLTFFVLACFSLMFFIMIFVFATKKSNRMLTLVSAALWVMSSCATITYFPPFQNGRWRQLDSGRQGDHHYYLAVHETASEGNFFELDECDRFGIFCQEIVEAVDWRDGWTADARLAVAGSSIQVVDKGVVLYER